MAKFVMKGGKGRAQRPWRKRSEHVWICVQAGTGSVAASLLKWSMTPAPDIVRYPGRTLQVRRFLSTRQDRPVWLAQLAEAPAKLRAAVAGLTDAQLDTPYRDGGWTVRQVVHHLADAQMNWYIRPKLAVTEDVPMTKTYAEQALV